MNNRVGLVFLIVASCLSVSALKSEPAQRTRRQLNRPPVIESIKPNGIEFPVCPIDGFEEGYILNLEVKANDPDNDLLTYNYSVSGGKILGEGAQVRWDLRRASLGRQKVVVEVTDQRGGKTSGVSEIRVIAHGACDPSFCPMLSVSCPTSVIEGEIATFSLAIPGNEPNLVFLWSHSNGHRFPGQKGPTLKIKAVGSPGDIIKATVTVLGLDPSCNRQASCETTIEKPIRSNKRRRMALK